MEPEERSSESSESSVSTGSTASSATAWWIAIGVLVVAVIGVWIWKGVAVDRAEDRLEAARVEWEEEARRTLARRTQELLALSAEPLGLAVRDAAMAENWGTVGTYLDRVARTEGVQRIVLVAGDTVRVSTDATLEGRPAGGVIPMGVSGGESSRVVETEDGSFHAAVPITGLNERLGLLVLTYVPPEAGFDGPGAEGADPGVDEATDPSNPGEEAGSE